MSNDTDPRLQAEDALLDGDFTLALQISHDLLSTYNNTTLPGKQGTTMMFAPVVPHIHLSSSPQDHHHSHYLPYAAISSISLHVHGEFSRCGAVLLQSWFELCQQRQQEEASSSGDHHLVRPYYYYLECLNKTTIPIDLLVVWMTLHQAQTGDTDGNVQVALKVFQKLLLKGAADVFLDEVHQDYREFCRELIVLVFIEWLPTLSAKRIQELRDEILPVGPNNSNVTSSRTEKDEGSFQMESLKACLQLCSELSAMSHEWTQETFKVCHTKLQANLTEMQTKLATHTTASNLQPHCTLGWTQQLCPESIKDQLFAFPSWCKKIFKDGDATPGIIASTVVATAFLIFGLQRVRSLLYHTWTINKRPLVAVLLQALGLGGR